MFPRSTASTGHLPTTARLVPFLSPAGSYPFPPPPADEGRLFGAHGLDVPELAAAVQTIVPTRVGEDGRLYAYADGRYVLGNETVAAVTRELLGRRFRTNHVRELRHYLGMEPASLSLTPDPAVFNVANGLLAWGTGELSPHTPAHPSTIRLPVAWDPTAECPAIAAFLAAALPPDTLDFVCEVAGYALYPGNPLRTAVLLLGPSGTGKSTLLALISALCGAENVSAVSLHDLQENRFAKAQLVGKLASICGDLDARAITGSDVFKQLTGGDLLYAEHKHGQPFAFRPFALPLFSANQAPPSTDLSDAWFARWQVIEMTRRPAMADPGLTARLTSPGELAGFLNLAIAGLRRLMTRGRFDPPASVRAAAERYRDQLDPSRRFVGECCVLEPGVRTKRDDLYAAYVSWCQDEGLSPQGPAAFYRRLETGWPGQILFKRTSTDRFFVGVRLRAE